MITPMISKVQLQHCLYFLGDEISLAFEDTDKLVVVGLLRGSFVFIADLVREIKLPLEVDFLEVSSYGNSMESSREVKILKDISGEIEGLDVLVVEDIIARMVALYHFLMVRLPICSSAKRPSHGCTCASVQVPLHT